MTQNPPLVSVCVCSYKRPALLAELLASLAAQASRGAFRYEIVVADNDRQGSARAAVEGARAAHPGLHIVYGIAPEQGLSQARNRSVALASGALLAFIDDDERAAPNWLAELFETLERHGADAVFGPVLPDYPPDTPAWVMRSRLFERPRHASGTRLTSGDARTSNALVRAHWARRRQPAPFDLRFAHSGGEDHDFFRWMEDEGARLVWCDSAAVSERVPPERQRLAYLLARRFRASVTYWRGENARRPAWRALAQAFVGAAGGLLLALLGLLVAPLGRHLAARVWVKSANGFGRVAALTALRPVGYGERHD